MEGGRDGQKDGRKERTNEKTNEKTIDTWNWKMMEGIKERKRRVWDKYVQEIRKERR